MYLVFKEKIYIRNFILRAMLDFAELEKKWQSRWFDKRISEVERETKKKFFIHFAYPGISGYLHVGHLRGFTYADIIARYKKMTGFNVCFPAGFHASGLPAVSLAKRIERGDQKTIKYLKDNGCPEATISMLSTVSGIITLPKLNIFLLFAP